MTIIKNKDMVYDKTRKRYRLSKDYVQNDLGTNLQAVLYDELDANPTTLPERTIKYASDMVYDYMKRECANYDYACELVETNTEINESFKDALSYQLLSLAQEGDKAFSADGSMQQSICPRSLQILLGCGLITAEKPKPISRGIAWDLQDLWADLGGGWY